MRKILLLIMLIAAVLPSTATSKQPQSLINENRIWEYRISQAGISYPDYFDFKMKFDGTKNISGKSYHIFKTIECEGTKQGPVNETWPVENVSTEFYIREDGDKLYAYDFSLGAPKFFCESESDEYLIYDFEKFDDGIIYSCDEFGEKVNTSVTTTKDLVYDDNTFTLYKLEGRVDNPFAESITIYDTFIDGIGRIYSGCLPYFAFDRISRNIYTKYPVCIPVPGLDVDLLRVTDLEGNVIFDVNATLGIKTPNAEYVSLSAEGGMLRYADIVPGTEIRIIDISGATVLSCRSDAESGIADISRLPRGLYIATAGAASLKFTR